MKLSYNSKQVDRSSSSSGPMIPPKPGVYRMKITEAKYEAESKQGERVVFVLRQEQKDGDGNGLNYGYWDYVALTTDWKVDQYLQAVGFDTETHETGEFDVPRDFVGKTVMGRVATEMYEGQARSKLKRVLPYIADDTDEDDDLSDVTPDPEPFPKNDIDMTDPIALGEYADETDDAKAIDALCDMADEVSIDPDEYETWGELATAVAEANKPKPTKRASKKAVAKKTAPAVEESDDAEEAGDDYESMTVEELQSELTDRELSTKGAKGALIARLRASDADPFAED